MAKYSEYTCQICGKKFPLKNLCRANIVRPTVVEVIQKSSPEWTADGFVCTEDLNRFRVQYVYSFVEAERGELSNLEKEVLESITHHDNLAQFVGSWTIIVSFALIISLWVIVNSVALTEKSFDPYPYILINLSLPEDADEESVKAEFKKGILHITVPRNKCPQSDVKKIEISGEKRQQSQEYAKSKYSRGNIILLFLKLHMSIRATTMLSMQPGIFTENKPSVDNAVISHRFKKSENEIIGREQFIAEV